MTLGELLCRKANYFDQKRFEWIEEWRKTRLIASEIRNSYAKRPVNPEKYMKLPGDGEVKKSEPMTKEEYNRLKELWNDN